MSKPRRNRPLDILSTGELLVDFISTDVADTLDEVQNFRRIPGGSPANLAMNMARLGNRVKLVSTIGNDDLGHLLRRTVEQTGVDVQLLRQVHDAPTTLILVTRSKTVANFEAYRTADRQIAAEQFPAEVLQRTRIFHTTCFALSQDPARTNILIAARVAAENGTQLSIDANYAEKIWSNRAQAQEVVRYYCSMGALVKMSEVDWLRLYEHPLTDWEVAAQQLLDFGAREVCLTLGGEGCYVQSAETKQFIPARTITVKDTTGAGDAFWSGYLTAWLDDHQPPNCALAGRKMAELKLVTFGPLGGPIARETLYADL